MSDLSKTPKARTSGPIAVIGLGYVGLPLAVEFGKSSQVIGFDINEARIAELNAGHDATREVSDDELRQAVYLNFSSRLDDLRQCDTFIVTVPTPIDRHNRPDLRPLLSASETVGQVLSIGDLVIYESTVFPGCTEEACVPVLEKVSGLRLNVDFTCGYSPERINPGDRNHRLTTITKVTSGSNPEATERVDALYASIITAGTYRAESIRVAEAAKVIENTQRDLNIALMNELSMIFRKMDIDTEAVLRAAGTKWNFLPFRPGLVGGHCIGVDPYYLTFKAEEVGHHPEIVLAGRRINNRMGSYWAECLVKALIARRITVNSARVLVLGLTFKENCPDLRNTRVIDFVRELASYGVRVDVHDPWGDPEEASREYGVDLILEPERGCYDGVVIAVAHEIFREMGAANVREFGTTEHVLFDPKWIFPVDVSDLR